MNNDIIYFKLCKIVLNLEVNSYFIYTIVSDNIPYMKNFTNLVDYMSIIC